MSESGISTLVLLIASLLIAIAIAGVALELAETFSADLGAIGAVVSSQIRVDVSIVSNPNFVYNNSSNTLEVHVKNTGAESVRLSDPANESLTNLDPFINGSYQKPANLTFVDSPGNPWRPGEVIKLTWNISLPANEEHTVSIVVEDNQDDMTFYNSG